MLLYPCRVKTPLKWPPELHNCIKSLANVKARVQQWGERTQPVWVTASQLGGGWTVRSQRCLCASWMEQRNTNTLAHANKFVCSTACKTMPWAGKRMSPSVLASGILADADEYFRRNYWKFKSIGGTFLNSTLTAENFGFVFMWFVKCNAECRSTDLLYLFNGMEIVWLDSLSKQL